MRAFVLFNKTQRKKVLCKKSLIKKEKTSFYRKWNDLMEKIIAALKRLERKLSKLETNVSAVSNLQDEGTLIISDSGGKKRFFRYLCKDEPLEYLGKSKNLILKPLAQKRYDTQLLKAVKKQKKAVDFCIKKLEEIDFEDLSKIYNDFPAELKQYIKPHMDDDEQYAAKWQAKNYATSKRENETENYTGKGEHVRSKSEVIIADRFYAKGIPYHYEPIFLIDENDYLVPDFIILNKRTRKEFLWEHFGMMEKPEYCLVALSKIETYAREGYIFGKNLICTFESKNHPLNFKYVDMLIEEYLR